MRKGRSTGTPTAAQVQRFEAIKDIGCLACYKLGLGWFNPEIHHLTIGGKHGQKRRGHDFTIGLCGWHHRGCTLVRACLLDRTEDVGPSYALEPRRFRQEIGYDAELLSLQNQLIEERTP